MAESLYSKAARQFLSRNLKSAGRGVRHVGAAIASLPLGTLEYLAAVEEYASMMNFYERSSAVRYALDEEIRLRRAAEWRKYLQDSPTLLQYIRAWDRALKH